MRQDYQQWLYSVMASTSDSDSGNPGSIPGTTFLLFLLCRYRQIEQFFFVVELVGMARVLMGEKIGG